MTYDPDKKWMLMPMACCVLLAALGGFAYVFNQTPDNSPTVRALEPKLVGTNTPR